MKQVLMFIMYMAAVTAGAQLPVTTTQKIDSMFRQWNSASAPGAAIGIVRNDSLLYAKGYGIANLEYAVAITPQTIFNLASVSKQFTAYSIVLLARKGKLTLDDDIRQYLPWFPNLGAKITIRNLLNHTSGIREADQLLGTAGTRLDDVVTQEEVIKVLSRQRALNFTPGTKYSYSNSNFTLLAEIVKAVSGQSLRQFTDSAIFKPLGMNNTHFHDNYTELVPNRAYSYYPANQGHYTNGVISSSNVGPGSLYSNINDLSKWVANFYQPVVGDPEDIKQLAEKGKLDDGTELKTALGIEVDSYSGLTRYSHSGSAGGFQTFVSILPDLKMGFIVLANVNNFKPQQAANNLADLFINNPQPKQQLTKPAYTDTTLTLLKDSSIAKFSGSYISDDVTQFNFAVVNRAWCLVDARGGAQALVNKGGNTFELFSHPEVRFEFLLTEKGERVVDEYWPGRSRHLVWYDATPKTGKALLTYTGRYYCPELDCSYTIALKDHQLVLENAKYEDLPLTLYGDDQLTNTSWWMYNIMVIRDRKKRITGFEVNSDRLMHLWFKKVN